MAELLTHAVQILVALACKIAAAAFAAIKHPIVVHSRDHFRANTIHGKIIPK
jgi:hypothetical protein